MKSALLIIDVQESFRQRPYWQDRELQPFLSNVQALADDSRRRGVPVLQVFHCEPPASLSNPFALESGHVRTLSGLQLQPAAVFHKSVHSALFGRAASGLTLEQWLQQHDIEEVLVTGIRTEQCCETTGAARLGPRICRALRERCDTDLSHAVAQRALVLACGTAGTHRAGARRALRPGGLDRRGARLRGRMAREILGMREICFVLLPQLVLLDLAGPAEAFRLAARAVPGSYALRFLAARREVRAAIGLELAQLEPLPRQLAPGTILVLLGVSGVRVPEHDPDVLAVVRWLRAGVARDATLLCVCAGSVVAARAGLLAGRECTTHHAHITELREAEPTARVYDNRIFVEDGSLWTSAGSLLAWISRCM